MAAQRDWLVVIDMQNVFAQPASPWFTPGFGAAAERIGALLPLFGERVCFTRFVPPARIEGSWAAYYAKWRFAAVRDDAALWALVAPWQDQASVDSHQFSKWGSDLACLTELGGSLVMCGVSNDCCVMATALAAVDGGAFVRVVAEACSAKTPEIHRAALDLLTSRAPQLIISDVRAEERRAKSG